MGQDAASRVSLEAMTEQFHRPVRRPATAFDKIVAPDDPAGLARVAHSTANALVARVRAEPESDIVARLVGFTDTHGIDTLAELWSHSPARTLPGALWRIYLLQLMIHHDPHTASLLYQRGTVELRSVDPVVAGATTPAGPEELVTLADAILRGVFEGDLAVALERAAAFCRVQATGATHVADDYEGTEPERAFDLTRRAARLAGYATDLTASARLWRLDALD